MKIYTRTGDQGESSLFDGTRVPKNHWRLEAYGTLDELNTFIGKALGELHHTGLHKKIPVHTENEWLKIQRTLFEIGSWLAAPQPEQRKKLKPLHENLTEELEKAIDSMTQSLPPLKNFILPGGHLTACTLHQARTVARRAERRILVGQDEDSFCKFAIQYINRLSDYLFVASRFVNFHAGISDVHWVPS